MRGAPGTVCVESWGVCSQAGAGQGSLTCGAPRNSRSPASGVQMRGRASAGRSTWASCLFAQGAETQFLLELAFSPVPRETGREGGAARWSPGQPGHRPLILPTLIGCCPWPRPHCLGLECQGTGVSARSNKQVGSF